MSQRYRNNKAEELFHKNINHHVTIYLIDEGIFEGKLLNIFHNVFIIETIEGLIEMCRYEDVRCLKASKI